MTISRPDCVGVGFVYKRKVRWRATHFPGEAGRPVVAANIHLTLA
ncbi:hypothetical protein ACVGWQ_14935, partial [Enterobacter hormaechei]